MGVPLNHHPFLMAFSKCKPSSNGGTPWKTHISVNFHAIICCLVSIFSILQPCLRKGMVPHCTCFPGRALSRLRWQRCRAPGRQRDRGKIPMIRCKRVSRKMGLSLNGGIPQWMVYKGKSYLNWMIWGYPYFR